MIFLGVKMDRRHRGVAVRVLTRRMIGWRDGLRPVPKIMERHKGVGARVLTRRPKEDLRLGTAASTPEIMGRDRGSSLPIEIIDWVEGTLCLPSRSFGEGWSRP